MIGFVGTGGGCPGAGLDGGYGPPMGGKIPDQFGDDTAAVEPPDKRRQMTKADLISKVAETTENTKTDCDAILSTAFNAIAEELKTGGTFAWPQFGKFEVVIRAARKGVNPATKQPIEIPQTTAVKFKAALALKTGVKG